MRHHPIWTKAAWYSIRRNRRIPWTRYLTDGHSPEPHCIDNAKAIVSRIRAKERSDAQRIFADIQEQQ